MQESTDPDEPLVRAARDGSEEAFEDLVRRHHAAVCRIAYRETWSAEEARDIAQEVFLRAYDVLPRWVFRGRFFTWLYRTTLNCARSSRRKGRWIEFVDHLPPGSATSPDPSAETRMIDAENSRKLRRILGRLPERQRQAVILRIYEDLSIRATAETMGCREGTVKALLHKALRRMALELEKEE